MGVRLGPVKQAFNVVQICEDFHSLRTVGAEKSTEAKTHKQNFHWIVPGFSRDLTYMFSPHKE